MGALPIGMRIIKRKLNLLFHILNLDKAQLAREILEEQCKFNFPGLVNETKEYIKELNLPDIISNRNLNIKKQKWKMLVKQAIKKKCTKTFQEKLPKFEKIRETMKNETFGKITYTYVMTMKDSQTYFKYRSHMTDVKFNYKHDQNTPMNYGGVTLAVHP